MHDLPWLSWAGDARVRRWLLWWRPAWRGPPLLLQRQQWMPVLLLWPLMPPPLLLLPPPLLLLPPPLLRPLPAPLLRPPPPQLLLRRHLLLLGAPGTSGSNKVC
jgi:hypothetical protein